MIPPIFQSLRNIQEMEQQDLSQHGGQPLPLRMLSRSIASGNARQSLVLAALLMDRNYLSVDEAQALLAPLYPQGLDLRAMGRAHVRPAWKFWEPARWRGAVRRHLDGLDATA